MRAWRLFQLSNGINRKALPNAGLRLQLSQRHRRDVHRCAPGRNRRTAGGACLHRRPQALRKIRFETSRYAPDHVVTIRSSSEGWTNDTFGTYRDGAWEFFFEIPGLPPTLAFKFVLDGEHWMQGADLVVSTSGDHSFDENAIQFPPVVGRFRHGLDNFRVERTKMAQDGVPRNTREDIFYDVIIIGSGMGGGPLADALSDAGVRTLVLEAGGLTLPTHMTSLPGDWSRTANHHRVGHFVNEPGSDFLPGVHLNLGGRSVYWSGLIPRMRDWELAFWPAPVRTFLQQQGYDRAETLMRKATRLGPFQDQVVATLASDLPAWQVENLPRSAHQPFVGASGQLGDIVQDSTGVFLDRDLLLSSLSYGNQGTVHQRRHDQSRNHLVTHISTNGTNATEVVCQDLLGNATRRYRGRVSSSSPPARCERPLIAINSGLTDPSGKLDRHLLQVLRAIRASPFRSRDVSMDARRPPPNRLNPTRAGERSTTAATVSVSPPDHRSLIASRSIRRSSRPPTTSRMAVRSAGKRHAKVSRCSRSSRRPDHVQTSSAASSRISRGTCGIMR